MAKKDFRMLSFVGKHPSFYPKDVCSFSVIFIKWKGVKPISILIRHLLFYFLVYGLFYLKSIVGRRKNK